jgi:hypothetical protein
MPVSDVSDLVTALEAGDFDQLLGTDEADWVDFKKEPYRFESQRERWEYAKDIASFANLNGGAVVIGVKTSRSVTQLESSAERYNPIPKKLIDPKLHADIVEQWIYPQVVGVRLRWFPPDKTVQDGLLLIEIPQQSKRDHPFIVRGMPLAADDDPNRKALGIPIREGSGTRWISAERLHAMIVGPAGAGPDRSGASQLVGQTLEDEPAGTAKATSIRKARAEARLGLICDEISSDASPCYALQGVPPGSPAFISDLHDVVRADLERSRFSLRGDMGFNVKFPGSLEVRDGGLVSLGNTRHALWLDRDGTFTYGVNAGDDFLGWGVNRNGPRPPQRSRINSLALVEVTLEFFRTVYLVLAPRVSAGNWSFRMAGRGWQRAGLVLYPGVPEGAKMQNQSPASADSLDELFLGTGSASHDAFVALQRVYGLFGLPPKAIPFAEQEAISEEAIKNR